MTGEDSYHAHCFKCKVCKNRIDDLVFAKTSQGIYCMGCHNERMIRIRKHNERKNAQQAASRSRTRENGRSASPDPSKYVPSPSRNGFNDNSQKRNYVNDAFEQQPPKHQGSASPALPQSISVTPAAPSPGQAVFHPPPRDSSFATPEQAKLNPAKQSTLPVATSPDDTPSTAIRRKSYDDGTRPLNVLYKGLDLPTSRKEKRRSINPGLTLKDIKSTANGNVAASSSPTSLSPHSAGHASNTPPAANDSPLREQFENTASRPTSNGSFQDYHPRKGSWQSSHSQDVAMPPSEPLSPKSALRNSGQSLEVRSSSEAASQRSPSLRSQQRLSVTDLSRQRSRSSSRAADVPHSVESGTDEDDERDLHTRNESVDSVPPLPPPKEAHPAISRTNSALQSPVEGSSDMESHNSQQDSSDDMSESSPVEQTSHATFIAPALPPIRFSMNTADFADLFSSVGGSMKNLASIQEGDDTPLTPPPSASSFLTNGSCPTPTSEVTVIGSTPQLDDDEDTKTLTHPPIRQASLEARPSLSGSTSSSSSSLTRSSSDSTRITLTTPGSNVPRAFTQDTSELVLLRLQQALADAKERGAHQLKLDRGFVEAIITAMETKKADYSHLKGQFDGVKRASKQYIEGLTVAQTEYDRELKTRRESEAEVTRLRVLLSGQAARLTALTGDSRRQELRQQMTKDLHNNLSGLEQDLSKLKVQRDMALAEVEELAANKSTAPEPANLSRTLTVRLEKLKKEYQRELVPLTEQREALAREITELKAVRDTFLEETTVLNARNEELAQLSAQYTRRMDMVPETTSTNPIFTPQKPFPHQVQQIQQTPSSYPRQSAEADDTVDLRYIKVTKAEADLPTPSKKFIKWPTRTKEVVATNAIPLTSSESRGKASEHNFQQLSILRFTRCDHCQEKMWGSQLRCTTCSISVHTRCVNQVQVACSQQNGGGDETVLLPPSMFGRDLTEQVHADAKGGSRQVPIIVEKCIDAVEAVALEYEGIYRKTGGTGQSRLITQLFERGDYNAFDLRDSDRFNDICSVTSVLKSYFRSLPAPLLTFELHDRFMSAVEIRDSNMKGKSMTELVNKLPSEHYQTLKVLMLHLYKVFERSDTNLMNARNLGVVFGPTLMRSPNPGAEFSDMAGKALSIEWLVENAPKIFT